jgi:hypothetical protein
MEPELHARSLAPGLPAVVELGHDVV